MAVGIQVMGTGMGDTRTIDALVAELSLIHISEPKRPERISEGVFCM